MSAVAPDTQRDQRALLHALPPRLIAEIVAIRQEGGDYQGETGYTCYQCDAPTRGQHYCSETCRERDAAGPEDERDEEDAHA